MARDLDIGTEHYLLPLLFCYFIREQIEIEIWSGKMPKTIYSLVWHSLSLIVPKTLSNEDHYYLLLFLVASLVGADDWSYPTLAANGEMTGKWG